MKPHDEPLSRDAVRGRDALLELPEAPPAHAAFRARLKREFAAGRIEAPARVPSDHAADAAPGGVRVRPLPAHRARGAQWRWLVAAAAGVAIVVAIGGQVLNAGPAWRLMTASGEGVATVDGRPITMNHAAELAAALKPGARVRVPAGCQIALASERTLAIQMTAETDATVPPVPGRWFRRQVSGEIHAGEWRITTGPGFAGARLAVTTPSARVEVTGTTLAVICQPQGTCVCVYEGLVKVGHDDRTDMAPVTQGRRRYMFVDDSRTPESDAMLPNEVTALAGFRDAMQAEMKPAR